MQNPMSHLVTFIDQFLAQIRSSLSRTAFQKVESLFLIIASFAAPAAALIGALISLVVAIKMDSFSLFIGGIFWIFLVIASYYSGFKLLSSCEKTLNNNPSIIASQEYLDVMAFICSVIAIGSFLGGVYFTIKLSSITPFLSGLSVALIMIYTVWLVLHPQLISTYVAPATSGGMDAIAILILSNKIYLRGSKILFGLLPAIGTLLMLNLLVKSFSSGGAFELISSGIFGATGLMLVLYGLLAPVFCYIFFVLFYLLLDVLRSILLLGLQASGNPTSNQPETINPSVPDNDIGTSISPKALKITAIGLLVFIVLVIIATKGSEFYSEYSARSEEQRIVENQLKAEEEQKKAAEAAEQERINNFTAAVRKQVKSSAIDLILDPVVNQKLREIFSTNVPVYESYFTDSKAVEEKNGLVYGEGCRKDNCENYRAFVVADTKTATISTVIFSDGRIQYFGTTEEDAPPIMKKWALTLSH